MKQVSIEEIDFEKGKGLVPIVVQDNQSKEVLTLAYATREALQLTMETGYAHFFRRSHGRVMKKGVTSGNYQKIVGMLTDCDLDAVVYLVRPSGPACHKGQRSCFHFEVDMAKSCD